MKYKNSSSSLKSIPSRLDSMNCVELWSLIIIRKEKLRKSGIEYNHSKTHWAIDNVLNPGYLLYDILTHKYTLVQKCVVTMRFCYCDASFNLHLEIFVLDALVWAKEKKMSDGFLFLTMITLSW